MAFDVIVFNQEELLTALRQGIKSIALCDNTFSLPDIDGIQYTIIGNVTIESADKPEEKAEETVPVYANVEPAMMAYSSSFNGSYGSFGGGSSSVSGSYQGSSYTYKYEYEYGSFSASYSSSYATSYEASFMSSYYSFISGMTFSSSFGGSFALTESFGGSYAGSYSGSFGGSYAPLEDIIEFGSSGIIFVNGYGINLI